MSELAFNLSGEPFEVPNTAAGWRVRKLKPKGAPEVVYGREGIPLVLPIDADMEDLRREARTEGRYRLDPIDDHNRTVPNAPAGYVCIHVSEPTVEPAPITRPALPGTDPAVIEAMRVNSELARSIVDKFPLMMESAAILLRAADAAGLPAREPRGLPEPSEGDDEADTDETPPKASGWAGVVETLIPLVTPAIMNAIASGKVQIPGGLGALLDCRRASPKASTAGTSPARSPVPGSRDAAPVASKTAATRRSGSRDPAPAAPETSSAPATFSDTSSADAEHDGAPGLAVVASSATEPSTELPTLDPAALAHFAAIQGALTFREGMLARALAAELSPAELRTWLAELRTLSVPEAVAKIRGVLGADGNLNTSGGVS